MMHPKVLSKIPDGHPHTWTAEQLEDYENLGIGMTMEDWREMDDAVYLRECSLLPGCTDWHVVEPDEVREPNSDDGPADPNPALERLLPDGDPNDWTEKDWQDVAERGEKLSADMSEALDDAIWDRMQQYDAGLVEDVPAVEGAAGASDLNKSTDDMTADELELWKAQVDKEIAEAVTGDKQETVTEFTPSKDAGKVPKGAPCLEYCKGPGNPKQVYDDHTELCPQHPDYVQGVVPKTSTSKSTYVSCKHSREKHFELEGGLHIFGSAYRDVKFITDAEVDVGVYMTDSWGLFPLVSPGLKIPWATKYITKQVVLEWPDFGLPDDDMPMVAIIQWMLAEMTAGKKFETGCLGGHGRTGTMLALLLVAQGLTPGKAIQRVRKDHCSKGVENKKQAEYVAEFYKEFHGNELWRKSKAERQLFNKMVATGHKNCSTSAVTTKTGGKWSSWSAEGGWSGHKDAEPVWNEEYKLWTLHTYKSGWKWNTELRTYTATKKEGDI